MADLSPPALAFCDGEPTAAATQPLSALSEGELLDLIGHLTTARARAHLEVLGGGAVPKGVKKAARAAAYKLKSAGVAGEAAPRPAAIDLSAFVDLEKVAVIGAPGVDGGTWLLLAQLPGTPGIEVELKVGEPPRIAVEEDLGRGRLRKLYDALGGGRAILTRADLAVRFIDQVQEQLAAAPGGLPANFVHVARWREVALSYGADGGRCDARAALGPPAPLTSDAVDALQDDVRVGYLVPPQGTVRQAEGELGALLHDDTPTDATAFRGACEEVLGRAAAAWRAQVSPEALADMLDLDADLLYSVGDHTAAHTALALADAMRGPDGAERADALRQDAMLTAFDLDAAWAHRQAHIAGHVHHD